MSNTQFDCTHCRLPVPAGLVVDGREEQFCCSGCAGAYDLIHGSGLDSFYRMTEPDKDQQALQRSWKTNSSFQEYDEPVFQSKYATQLNASDSMIVLQLEGIHCGACVWLLEKLPLILPGVIEATVNWTRRTISIRWRIEEIKLSTIASTLKQLGYAPIAVEQSNHHEHWRTENRRHLIRIGVAAACAGNNMIISAALYLGMFSHMSAGMTQLMRVASCLVGLVALLWPGRLLLQSAWAAIRTWTPHMDMPIALALSVGTVAGLANVVRGTGEIYFDSLSVLIFLLLIGRWIQFRQQTKAANAVELLYRLTPQTTRQYVNGEVIDTLVDLVEQNDMLEIRPGDLFPVDGQVVDGQTEVDESILTGESSLVAKIKGSSVAAGTKNETSLIVMRADKVGRETRLSQIVELVERASLDKPEIVQWANRIGGIFVIAVILLASLTFAWWVTLDIEVAIDRSVALLIVACPCALALATPLAIAVALGRAAKQQIMVKGGDVLQSLQHPGMFWLDKTGTLTEGDLEVACWYGDTNWIDIVAALERRFSHPISKAFVKFSKSAGRPELKIRDDMNLEQMMFVAGRKLVVKSASHPGMGISGDVGIYNIAVGNEKLLKKLKIEVGIGHRSIANRILRNGISPCWVVVNDRIVAIAALGDSIRSEAAQAIDSLKLRGWQVGILSGDHQEVVNRVARRLGITAEFAIGEASPEEKLAIVSGKTSLGSVVESSNDSVAMVGDGVNDSAALAAATIGIAVKNGAEASLAAAPVYLAKPGLSPILELLSISDSASRTMRSNLVVSLTYNITFAALAFLGYINPLVAAILMPISSITVVALSLRSGR